jgi:hypothetical protein
MKRREMIKKVVLGGITLGILPTVLNSCSKKDEAKQEETLTVDLNDQANAVLLNAGGYLVINNRIIVAYTGFKDLPYSAADASCTYCGGHLKYTGTAWVVWECSDCHSKFGWDGNIDNGPATNALKVYNVSSLGNILTIHLG